MCPRDHLHFQVIQVAAAKVCGCECGEVLGGPWVDPGLGVERAKAKNSTDASTTITAGLETSPLWAKRGRMKRLT